ncbi:cytochrome o ubiquinol oxidase subunit IV [Lichenibacterium ramalinae]|uniref:Cytochrome bo(3) ubiquinol oxidase subunit 4 n=1 Tax=Lichenibacterium ramalinae TaxID=2316527 RepID=A0A4Q2R923_9HYPH|nr:cytochrome o ubiquinol oxidase subunit IV [Lichenibacterium ramalinae]RYB02333.1 cytochrome o ubiquinol oxidase subunit IV [Lichenibacterium ramalinae]
MSDTVSQDEGGDQRRHADTAPGDEFGQEDIGAGLRGYSIGLGLAALLTVASFVVLRTQLVWAPAIPLALIVFAIAQMGVHLVFFLHITTGPDNTNNVMALAFGVLIVVLVVGGSVWIMGNMNRNMMPMGPTAPMESGMPGH